MEAKSNILLVDDEPRFIDSLHDILTHYQYNCTKTLTGLKAIEQLRTGHFNLALLDINLPDVSGCDLVQFIKTFQIPTAAVMLTGERSIETAVNAMKLGAYDFLIKPVNHELLTKTIDKALQYNKIKRQLQVSEQRFKILSESAWEAVLIYENDKIIEANSQFLNMFGYTHREMLQGIVFRNIIASASAQIVRQFIEQEIVGSCELSGVKKDGTEFFIEIKSRQLTYLNKPRRVCVIRDISERIRSEEERLAMQQKLAKANRQSALGLMAGSVAHDLNNILSGIVSYPDLLLMQMSSTDKYYGPIKKIQKAGKRAAAVVADLMAIARSGASPKKVENINDIVLDYLSSIEHDALLANFPSVVFQTELYENLYNTCCSPHNFHKILINLISNAAEAIEEKGVIHISTDNCRFSHPLTTDKAGTKVSDFVRLTISDNGPGISQKDAENIFDPFYTTKIMGKSGTGLGLTIVWNIVQDHNGWIEIKDNKPGAIFEINLPAVYDLVRRPFENIRSADELRGNGESILLIDDQFEQNEIIEKALQEMGYVTYLVTSGEDGIAFLQSNSVDLVLLDMMLGIGLNGREVFEEILKIHPHQKTIIISGYAKSDEILKVRSLGVSDFIEKPVTISKIGQAVRHSLVYNLSDNTTE